MFQAATTGTASGARTMRFGRRRPLVPLLLAALASTGLVACGSEADSNDSATKAATELTVAGFLAPGSPWRNTYEWWMEEVEARTDGQVTFELFDQGSLLAQDAIMPGVRDGRADIGFFIESFHPAELPLSTIAGVPFLTSDSEAQTRAHYELYDSYEPFHSEYDEQNIQVLYFPPATPNTFQSTQPINGLADLQGKQVRALGMMSQALTPVGGNPVAIPLPEVYESLDRELIQANLTGFELITDLKLQEVTKHVIDPGSGLYAMGVFGMNADSWQELTDEQRDVMNEVSREAMLKNVEEFTAAAEVVCKDLLAADVEVSAWPEGETQEWRDQVFDDLRSGWITKASSAGAPADEFFEMYTAALAKHEAASAYEPGVAACIE